MIIKNIFMSLLGFGLFSNHVAAQYINHLQQVYLNPNERRHFETKALTPVDVKKQRTLQWAFASTISENGQFRALLVKLKENIPNATPFQFEWGKQYIPSADVSLDVEDVQYVGKGKGKGYILCGKWTQGNDSFGFLLQVDKSGKPKTARVYKEIYSFKSVVPWQKGQGYIAVGQTQANFEAVRDAAYVSVKVKKLEPKCGLRITGTFPFRRIWKAESGFNKVIQYKVKKDKLYAAVGQTVLDPDEQCLRNSDTIVALADENCELRFVRQYGDPLDDEGQTNERGLSIAQADKKKGGFIITGGINKIASCSERKVFEDDVLVFKISKDGDTVDWWRHYDVNNEGLVDFGTAVETSNDRKKKDSILVAGQTTTRMFGEIGMTGVTKDAFLMEVSKKNGSVKRIDTFGLTDSVDNGALRGNLDLHQTNSNNVVMMGNARLEPNTASNPYLIEKYKTIEEHCYDEPSVTPDLDDEFTIAHPLSIVITVTEDTFKVDDVDFPLTEKMFCPKEEPGTPTMSPTDSPTSQPSSSPSDDPTSEPSTETPTPQPTHWDTSPPEYIKPSTDEPTDVPTHWDTSPPYPTPTFPPFGPPPNIAPAKPAISAPSISEVSTMDGE